jgi:hypothetical protein
MIYDPASADNEIEKQGTSEHTTKVKQINTNRGALICLLLLLYLIVANIGYNLWVKGKNAPIQKLLTANVIRDLWITRRITLTKDGTVVGILYSKEKPCALINRELVYEGDITNGVKVVKINERRVEFEKNGQRWTQKVLANPNSAWKTAKQPAK